MKKEKIIEIVKNEMAINYTKYNEILKIIQEKMNYKISFKTLYFIKNEYNITFDNSKRLEAAFLRTHGVKNCGMLPEVKEKIKETTLKNYGVDCSWKSKDVIKKIKQTKKERYDKVIIFLKYNYKIKYFPERRF